MYNRDVDFGFYGLNGTYRIPVDWAAMGNWILVYWYNPYREVYNVVAYKVDHDTKRIIAPAVMENINPGIFNRFLFSQDRNIPS